MIDEIKYTKYSAHEHYIILYDKFDKTFCIHSKDEDNDIGMINGFPTAADAIRFAENRVVSVELPSTKA